MPYMERNGFDYSYGWNTLGSLMDRLGRKGRCGMDRTEALRVFCAAAESLNFRAAAARLGRSPQDVTRAVKELESAFGEVLFHRSTRKVQITAFGEQLAARARDALHSIDELFQTDAQQGISDLLGRVRITAPGALARRFLMPALARVAAAHPEMSLEMRLGERLADVVQEQIDVGVRVGFMRDQRFVARPVAKLSLQVVAAPSLVRRVGAPAKFSDLKQLPITALIDVNSGRAWPWHFTGGQQFVPADAAFVTDDPESECDAVLAGLGFGQIPGFLAIPHIRARRLISVLDDAAPDPWDIYVYRPQRAPVPSRVRLIYDCLVDVLSNPEVFPVEAP
jgi:DNA-binding transcriptional LysR family regulator